MKLLKISALLSVMLLLLISCMDSGEEPREWELVWQDEFDTTAGTLPDTLKWGYDIGTDWGNAQLEYDTDRPENATVNDSGHLEIIARKESYEGCAYTSARITTKDLYEFEYGRVEARIKLPWGQGLWPAFWLLGADYDTTGWPLCGEIDIMEYRGQDVSTVHGTVHGPGYSGANGISNSYELDNDRFDNDFHIFAVEWGPDRIDWFVDEDWYHSVTPDDLPGDWVFDHPFYIILNLAVGGNYLGPPDADTVFPQTMAVDYVRVYSEK